MPNPGLYLVNSTGEPVAVHTEGHVDLQLLAEYLEENDLANVCEEVRATDTVTVDDLGEDDGHTGGR